MKSQAGDGQASEQIEQRVEAEAAQSSDEALCAPLQAGLGLNFTSSIRY